MILNKAQTPKSFIQFICDLASVIWRVAITTDCDSVQWRYMREKAGLGEKKANSMFCLLFLGVPKRGHKGQRKTYVHPQYICQNRLSSYLFTYYPQRYMSTVSAVYVPLTVDREFQMDSNGLTICQYLKHRDQTYPLLFLPALVLQSERSIL